MNQGNEKAEVKKQTTLRLPAELYEALEEISTYLGISFNTLVNQELKKSINYYPYLL